MPFIGSGTRASPIAIDDSDDEVVNIPSHNFTNSMPVERNNSMIMQQQAARPVGVPPVPPVPKMQPPPQQSGKRKRADSFTQQSGPSNSQRPHPSLANRITHPPPEGKKARKRRRKAERQAAEEARIQNINWLNNAFPPVPPPFPLWSHPQPYYDELMAMQSAAPFLNPPPPMYRYPYEELPYGEAYTPARSPTPPPQPPLSPPPSPPRTSDWVSSMSMASLQDREPPPPPPPQYALSNAAQPNVSGGPIDHSMQFQHPPPPPPEPTSLPAPKPAEQPQHALPAKPTAVHTQTIGMKPDQDPNSKHGIFHISPSNKEGGTGFKQRTASYIPNPARTLVMEQLPKSHRGTDFINKWSRGACGALPVHIFIDGQAAKALIEFATAEQARKAWASPKLGQSFSGLKPSQLKGKPREDLIKVWWYRVDGVGAGAGVGEIEEGEIEDDPAAAETKDGAGNFPPKESKKERKARLAREREAKRAKVQALKDERARVTQELAEQHALLHPESVNPQTTHASSSMTSQQETLAAATTPMPGYGMMPPNPIAYQHYQSPLANIFSQHALHGEPNFYHGNFSQAPWFPPPPHAAHTQASSSMSQAQQYRGEEDQESIASSTGRSPKPPPQSAASTHALYGQPDDLDGYEDMDVELDDVTPPPSATFVPSYQSSHDEGWPAPPVTQPTTSHALPKKPQTVLQPSSKPKPLPPSSAMAAVFVPRHQPGQSQSNAAPSAQNAPTQRSGVAPPTSSLRGLVITGPSETSSTTLTAATSAPPSSSTMPTPSEPKAMKNAPTEPRYTKRALMARQKELEERIAQTKKQLAAAGAVGTGTSTGTGTGTSAMPNSSSSGTSTPLQASATNTTVDADKQAMEDRLRKLVLQTRKSLPKPEPGIETDVLRELGGGSLTTAIVSPAMADTGRTQVPGFSLEDMAVSFIAEAIGGVKAAPPASASAPSAPSSIPPTPAPAPPAPAPAHASAKPPPLSQSNIKSELAAKQKRLEQHIAETKALMEQLSHAKTKEARDEIMKVMREKRRLFESDSTASDKSKTTTPIPTPTPMHAHAATSGYRGYFGAQATYATAQQFHSTRWPVTHRNAGVLIVSDDEDEDDDDDEEDDGDDDDGNES